MIISKHLTTVDINLFYSSSWLKSFSYTCRYIDEHQSLYIQRLADSVAIQSVSAWPEKRGEIKKQVVQVAEVGLQKASLKFHEAFSIGIHEDALIWALYYFQLDKKRLLLVIESILVKTFNKVTWFRLTYVNYPVGLIEITCRDTENVWSDLALAYCCQ